MHRVSCQPGDTDPSFQWIQQSAVWQGKNSSTCTSHGEMLHIPSARSEQQFHCRITWNKTHIESVLEARSPPASIAFDGTRDKLLPFPALAYPSASGWQSSRFGFFGDGLDCLQNTEEAWLWATNTVTVLPLRSLHFREAELCPTAPAGRNRLCSSSHAMPALQTTHRNKHFFTLQWVFNIWFYFY